MEALMQNPYGATVVYFVVTVVCLAIFLSIFELVTRYKDWEEIKKGNLSVAMAAGGKLFGIANVFRFSIEHNDTLLQTLVWGAYGFVLLLLAYFVFEFLTPGLKVDEEIAKDNRAVGLLSMIISIGTSYIVGASIT